MPENNAPEWAQPGSTVYVERVGGMDTEWRGPFLVERVTKTRIVLNDGEWYPINRLLRSEGDYSPTRYLKPKNAQTLAAIRRYNRVNRARGAYYELTKANSAPKHNWTDEQFEDAIRKANAFIRACAGQL